MKSFPIIGDQIKSSQFNSYQIKKTNKTSPILFTPTNLNQRNPTNTMPDAKVHDRVPNNSSIDFGSYNNTFKSTSHKVPTENLRHPNVNSHNQPLAVQCLNCGNMAKNFLYLESFLKTNSSKKSCNTCSSSLSYLQFLNKNIEEVFKNINAASSYGGSPQKEVLPPQMQAVWTSQTTQPRRPPTVTAAPRRTPSRNQTSNSTLLNPSKRTSTSTMNRRASVGSRSALRKKAGSDVSASIGPKRGLKSLRAAHTNSKKIIKPTKTESVVSTSVVKSKPKKRKSMSKQTTEKLSKKTK